MKIDRNPVQFPPIKKDTTDVICPNCNQRTLNEYPASGQMKCAYCGEQWRVNRMGKPSVQPSKEAL